MWGWKHTNTHTHTQALSPANNLTGGENGHGYMTKPMAQRKGCWREKGGFGKSSGPGSGLKKPDVRSRLESTEDFSMLCVSGSVLINAPS